MSIDLDAYLQRIGLGRVERGEAGLRALHEAQALAVPFENVDVFLGRPLRLDPEGVFDKVVRRRRGGYCFELNGLLCAALQAAGFTARLLLARVFGDAGPGGRTHALVLAEVEGRELLCDAGFGSSSPRTPLPFELGREDAQLVGTYRLRAHELGVALERRGRAGDFEPLYAFDRAPVLPADLTLSNHYTATFPQSRFVTTLVAALQTREGRVTLENLTFGRHAGGALEQRALHPSELVAVLARDFGIEPDEGFAALPARLAAR